MFQTETVWIQCGNAFGEMNEGAEEGENKGKVSDISGGFMGYGWCEYYRQAYEKEKKRNTVLAGKVADAEGKKGELQAKYAAICANPFYRMIQPFSRVKRGCGKAVRKAGKLLRGGRGGGIFFGKKKGSAERKAAPEELSASYEERLAAQRDGYGQWILEEEPILWQKCRDVLSAEQKPGMRKSCCVVSYRELAGITGLEQVVDGGDIILFAEHPEDLDERAVPYIEDFFTAYPGTKLLYGAEDHRIGEKRIFPWFKPCWSPDTLLGFFYFGSYFALESAWAKRVSFSGHGDARQNLYDFVIRLLRPYYESVKFTMPASEIVCTDLILYHQRNTAVWEMVSDREYFLHTGEMNPERNPEFWGYQKEFVKLKQDFINKTGYKCISYRTPHPEVWSVLPEPERNKEKKEKRLVSVVIPSRDHPELLKKCIGSFLERTFLPGLKEAVEFIVVDNGSDAKNRQTIQAFLESLEVKHRYLYRPMVFNFSAMCNLGVREAEGEYILLLNDDMEIIEENWLRILLGQALLPGTGAVGAKLWYPEGERIQHAGITNMHIGPSHKLVTFPDDRTYYYGHNTVTYDMIAVTAACLLVKKTAYEEAGGLDEEMAVSYNDVDLCFKLAEAGYRNVVRNDAVLLHHESASRGSDEGSGEKWLRLLQEKTKLYKKHPLFNKCDPYYSEMLADNAPDYRIGYQYPYERRLLTETPKRQEGKATLQRLLCETVMLTVERAGDQHKIHLEEPDILETEGWCYMLGRDNCLFERQLVLEAGQGDFYYRIPVRERLRPDVEAILPLQKNIGLSGFVCKILKEDIISGNYTVGILYGNSANGTSYYQRSDKSLQVE